MSKRKRKKYFDNPSKTPEQYMSSLAHAESDDTVEDAKEDPASQEAGPTDSPLHDDKSLSAVIPHQGIWEKFKKGISLYGTILAIVTIIIGICIFFYDMKSTVSTTKEEIGNIKEVMEATSADNRIRQEDIKLNLTTILGKLETLLYNFRNRDEHKVQETSINRFKESKAISGN